MVDLKGEFILAAEILPANRGDASSVVDSVLLAQVNLDAAATLKPQEDSEQDIEARVGKGEQIKEVAADKGYHKAQTLELLGALDYRTYIPEQRRKTRRVWRDKPAGHKEAVYANARRVRGNRSKRLQRQRSEKAERSFAHLCETGGTRRSWLRGIKNVAKRYLVQAAAHNLALLMRKLFGVGKPRCLQGSGRGLAAQLLLLLCGFWTICWAIVSHAVRHLNESCSLPTQPSLAR